ncbi:MULTISPECIES: ATP-dependent RNA helicase HrpA [unclassified Pseudoxanthomonas]|uniref:ATP-dependent RNA helicase HrpA n=1 Tax=unclassified Pseudoxanthomonas TaxID=2645906 RepID=UPI001611DB67|nr:MULTISPECIES: ATP-dependent RNA helicase HrpA [unclassified Pseudoxanthomonas]MBB3275423.1 ATP-dependent helicase HrpA [Pseudoxanthomonas sp. OG2]MBD9377010.1 ATP-dependent RNA helicase HrpA [Pseudoxanthomonas sp. PXM04]MBV7473487.1 ATP-dependent RNA helicase HrpA [Pseudoxanthomonas sp. PXM05]
MNAIEPSPDHDLQAARRAIDGALSRDRGRLHGLWSRWQSRPRDAAAREAFAQALAGSVSLREARAASVPEVSLDEALPIAREGERIVELIRRHPVVVIAGETGSGKTTQLPKLCLAAGRGVAGMIGCTQPRRIAARAVARRVAEELKTGVGDAVGYQVRFTDQVGDNTRVKFMTDGILLAEIASDRWLSAYDTIIVDEAHERSLNIDFLLGYLKQLLRKRRDLKVIVTSATIDTERFSRHFDDAPVISVEGRTYPVEVRYRPLEGEGEQQGERTVNDAIVAAVDEITRQDPRGDVLMFLPGEREIRDAHQALERRKYRETEVLPLYARLSAKDQDRVFNPGPKRRLVLATNVAETSLTVPRIRYVVDPGYARVKRYSPRQKLDRLHIEPVSQASANQRKGRCGRIAEGICYRLYAEADFQARAEFTDPEIRRSSLAGVILRMLQLGLGRIEDFPFLEPPDERAIADGWQQLAELGAVDKDRKLTTIGRQMARLPVDVKLARMLVAAQQHRCLREMIIITAFLGIQDPRERPPEAREAADNAHATFADARSEFLGIVKLWDAYRQAHEDLTQSKLRDWCERHFLGFLRMREWRELHRQLLLLCEELGWTLEAMPAANSDVPRKTPERARKRGDSDAAAAPATADGPTEKQRQAAYVALHRALIAGLPTQVGHRGEKGDFQAPRQRRFQVFPGSALAKKPPPWMLSATLLDTQRVWGLTNAAIEPDWVIAEVPHLLMRKHFDPHWSRAQGHVLASEQISLFGLVLAPKKPVHYGRIAPVEAHDIFVRQALVTGEINTRASFVADNLKTLEQAREEEAKLRRAGLVADEDWQARWYLDRIPPDIHSAAGLDAWWKGQPPEARRRLLWTLADLLPGEGSEEDRFPKYFALGDARLPLHYRFEPGAADDGVTLEVPLHLLNALDPARLSWLAPGFIGDKASGLIRSLPKAMRRNYVPAPDFGRAFFEAYPQATADDIRGELARFLSRTTGVTVAATDFDESALEPHLRMNLRLREDPRKGGEARILAESRDLDELRARFGERAGQAFAARAGRAMAASGLREFPAQPIPLQVPGEAGVPAFPALRDDGDSVALQVFADRVEAEAAHPAGVRRLLEIALADRVRQARKQLPVAPKVGLLYAAIERFAEGDKAGEKERLRADIADAALNAVLADGLEGIRDRVAFEQRRDDAGRRLFGEAMERLKLAEAILSAVAELKPQLESPLMGWARGNLDDLRAQLDGLVHPGFLRDTPAQALAELPRYLKGMRLRAERALRDPVRDQARMLEIKPFADALADATRLGVARQPGWQALRWELEELRVSMFAQELGARGGVSPKKLAQRLQALRG